MTRLCVIGNSHTVAIRASWAGVPLLDEVDATFFCARGISLRHLKISGDAIVPTRADVSDMIRQTSRGRDRIVPADYDAALLVGLQVGARSGWTSYTTHRIAAHARRHHVVISDACLAATFDSILAQSTAAEIVPMLQSLGLRDIYIVPEPSPPEQYATGQAVMRDAAINAYIYKAFDAALSRLEQRCGVTVVRQRAETLKNGLTLARYSVAADEIARGEDASGERILHADTAFGLLVAQDVGAALAPTLHGAERNVA